MSIKKIVGFAAALPLLLPVVALASANVTFLTLDGSSNATVEAGSSVDAKVTYDITGATNVESFDWQVVGSDLPQTCVDVSDRTSTGTFNATFPIDTTGGTEGTWDVKVRAYGDSGPGADNNCGSTVLDTQTFNNRLTLTENANDNNSTANNTGNTANTGGKSAVQKQIDSLAASMKALTEAFAKFLTGGAGAPAPAPSTGVCSMYMQVNAGTVPNQYSPQNVKLQGFLLAQGMSIPALAAGASFGYYGNQTTAAVGVFQSINHCQ